tara:strand:+ start:498 stop:992 length:495 start_codon:yes stop_codon:yes gene_type:complete
MRYPDYLADELLERFDQTGDKAYLTLAEKIFSSEEPDLRRFPMIRWRFGAYERMDDALSILLSRGLIRIGGRKLVDTVLETDFFVMPKAIQTTTDIISEYPTLQWYIDRANLVADIANGRGGAALKKRQYQRIEYADTALGEIIPSITNDVLNRLEEKLNRVAT